LRIRLASGFSTLLRVERGMRTQQQLADMTRMNVSTIKRLEGGYRRPTAASVWAIARALRTGLRSRVALDERLRQAAGESFRDSGRRPHAAREQMRLQLRFEADGAQPVGDGDNLGAILLAELGAAARRGSADRSGRW
jgi:transcriptional regulator with XRE-family HTH domain